MTESSWTAFADPELSELFDREPELLAIADAITATSTNQAGGCPRGVSRRERLRRLVRRRTRLLVLAVVVLAVGAAPAFAFSAALRELIGRKSPHPVLRATLTGAFIHKPRPRYGPPVVTVTFTIGEPGKPPGVGIPFGSYFLVALYGRKAGGASGLVRAYGRDGRYSATTHLPPGGVAGVQIGGWLNIVGSPTAAGGFWIPVTVTPPAH